MIKVTEIGLATKELKIIKRLLNKELELATEKKEIEGLDNKEEIWMIKHMLYRLSK